MSCTGKSTLLNALVGRELLPMNNVPETARICKIVHNANTEPYLQEPPSAEGSARKGAAAKEPVVSPAVFAAATQRHSGSKDAARRQVAVAGWCCRGFAIVPVRR